ncbi:MAG: hypothetical protein GYA56_13630 [Geobacteraceae bacterium]|nr:hypothetical protein [Geobacteraceae bacterium]
MTESVVRVGDAAAVSGNGAGPARKRDRILYRSHHDEDHDSVTISDEARRRSLVEEDDVDPDER